MLGKGTPLPRLQEGRPYRRHNESGALQKATRFRYYNKSPVGFSHLLQSEVCMC